MTKKIAKPSKPDAPIPTQVIERIIADSSMFNDTVFEMKILTMVKLQPAKFFDEMVPNVKELVAKAAQELNVKVVINNEKRAAAQILEALRTKYAKKLATIKYPWPEKDEED